MLEGTSTISQACHDVLLCEPERTFPTLSSSLVLRLSNEDVVSVVALRVHPAPYRAQGPRRRVSVHDALCRNPYLSKQAIYKLQQIKASSATLHTHESRNGVCCATQP